MSLTLAQIRAAAAVIARAVPATPLVRAASLSERAGCELRLGGTGALA